MLHLFENSDFYLTCGDFADILGEIFPITGVFPLFRLNFIPGC